MKRKAVLVIFVCLCFTFSAYSQQRRIINGDEFFSTVENAEKKSRVFPRRHLVTGENYSNGEIVKTTNFLWEAVSDERQRIVSVEKVGTTTSKLETIEIGLDVYKRVNDGAWRKEEWKYNHGVTEERSELLGCSETAVESTVFRNQNARIFETFQIGTEGGALTYTQERFWIDGNGNLLKQETIYGLLNPRSIISRRELIYEYNVNIKIEAPIL